MKIAAIDFETANSSPASVCAVGVSVMDENGAFEEKYYSLIKPADNVSSFTPFNITIHHITPQMVSNAPLFTDIYPHLNALFQNAVVCAHNARFDMTCLKDTCLNNHLPVPQIDYFDTVVLARHAFPYLKHHRLDDLCTYLDIDLNHHHAGSDAWGCLLIVAACMNLSACFDIEKLLAYYHVGMHHMKEE